MAALNFPANPSLNDEYSANSATWRWNGTAWVRLGTGAQGYQGVQGADGAQGYQGYQGTGGASATIQNEANNRVITATSTPGTLNANQYFVHDGTNTGIGTDALGTSLHVMDANHWDESTIWEDNAGQLIRNVDTEIAIGKNSSPGNIWIQGRNSSSLAQDITINPSGGNIGIGTDDPGYKVHVEGTGEVFINVVGDVAPAGGGANLRLQNKNTTANSLSQIQSADAGGQTTSAISFYNVDNSTNEGYMMFLTRPSGGSPTEAARFTSSGNLRFPSGQGIDFSATANSSGTMSSELLDDYEEGSWTPSVFFGATAATVSSNGKYTKIGNLVHISYQVTISNLNSGSGNIAVGGLPYSPSQSPTYSHGNCQGNNNQSLPTGAGSIQPYIEHAVSTFRLLYMTNSGHFDITQSHFPAGVTFYGDGDYYTA